MARREPRGRAARGVARPARDLSLLAFATGLSAAGDMVAVITLALCVHELTGSAFAVSALFAATMIPVVAMAPLAGRIADRFESTRVLLIASIVQAAIALALVFAGDVASILALTALLTAGAAIAQPAEFALVPAVAAPDRLAAATGRMEAARYAGHTAGPLLAAGLVALGGAATALAVNAASFAAVTVAAACITARRHPEPNEAAHARGGLHALLADRVLRPVILAAVGALLLISSCMTAEVFYVKDVLHEGDTAYAALFAAWMAGMVAGAVALPQRVPKTAMAAVALIALGVQGAGMAGQTIVLALPAAFAGFVVGGVGHGLKNALIRTVIADRVPRHVHGRAFAAYNAARNAAEAGALGAAGLLVAGLGPRTALLVAGLGPVIAAAGGLLALATQDRQRGLAPRLQPLANDA